MKIWQKFQKKAPFTAGALKWGGIASLGVGLGFGGAFAFTGLAAGWAAGGVTTALATSALSGVIGGAMTAVSAFVNLAVPVAIFTGISETGVKITKRQIAKKNPEDITVDKAQKTIRATARAYAHTPRQSLFFANDNHNAVKMAFSKAGHSHIVTEYNATPRLQKTPARPIFN